MTSTGSLLDRLILLLGIGRWCAVPDHINWPYLLQGSMGLEPEFRTPAGSRSVFCSIATPHRQVIPSNSSWDQLLILPMGRNFPAEPAPSLEMGKASSEGSESPSCISCPGKQSSFSLVEMEEEHQPASEEGAPWCPHNTRQTQSLGVYCPGFDCPEYICKAVSNTDHLGISIC